MSKFLQIAETTEEETRRRARSIIESAVRSCNSAIAQMKDLAADRGGKAAFLVELDTDAAGVRSACLDLKTLVEKLSDLPAQDLEA